jgi:hypothetical protein
MPAELVVAHQAGEEVAVARSAGAATEAAQRMVTALPDFVMLLLLRLGKYFASYRKNSSTSSNRTLLSR